MQNIAVKLALEKSMNKHYYVRLCSIQNVPIKDEMSLQNTKPYSPEKLCISIENEYCDNYAKYQYILEEDSISSWA